MIPLPGFGPQVEHDLKDVLEGYHQWQQPPGALLAAQQDDAKRWSNAVGVSDLRARTAIDTEQSFRIGSLTTAFVATLVLMLEEDRVLSIEDKLSKWVPTFPEGDKIPLYRLLNHTSGIATFEWAPGYAAKARSPEELVLMAILLGPRFEPGQEGEWEYSSTNYLLLGMVIERATGKKWHDLQRERILRPFGLTRTFVEEYEEDAEPQIKGHALVNGALTDVTESYAQVFWAAGGMVSTIGDLTRFFTQLESGKIISWYSLTRMNEQYNVDIPKPWVFKIPSMPEVSVYQYGLGVRKMIMGGESIYGNYGSLYGYQPIVGYRARDRVTVAAFVNAWETPAGHLMVPAFVAIP